MDEIPRSYIISLISVFYAAFRSNAVISEVLEGMQAGVGAVIAAVVYEMGHGVVHSRSSASILIMAASFIAACVFQVNVIYIVLACIALGAVRTCIHIRKEAAR